MRGTRNRIKWVNSPRGEFGFNHLSTAIGYLTALHLEREHHFPPARTLPFLSFQREHYTALNRLEDRHPPQARIGDLERCPGLSKTFRGLYRHFTVKTILSFTQIDPAFGQCNSLLTS